MPKALGFHPPKWWLSSGGPRAQEDQKNKSRQLWNMQKPCSMSEYTNDIQQCQTVSMPEGNIHSPLE